MAELIGALSAILAVIGVVLNNRKLTACFYLWLLSNALSAYLHLSADMLSLAGRDVVFFVLAAEGLYQWKYVKGGD